MTDPCAPHIHSQATLKAWRVWRLAHPHWKATAIAIACGGAVIGAAAAAPPFLFVPGEGRPALVPPVPPAPPAWHEGAGPCCGGSAGQGFYIPPREGSEFSPYVPSGETSPILTGFSPTPGETLPLFPPTVIGSAPPRTAVPEPASLVALAVGAVGAVFVRRRRG